MPRRRKVEKEVGLWQLRIHYGEYNLGHLVDFIKARCDLMICVRETDSARAHIHCVITGFAQTLTTFRQQLLKEFPKIKGNQSYSLNVKDDYDAQLRYCCKGENKDTMPDVLYVDVSKVDIRFYHEKYWEHNLLLKAKSEKDGNMGLQKDTSLVVKAKSKTWTEKVYGEIKELYTNEILIIQTFQMLFKPTEEERRLDLDSRKVIFRYVMKRFGSAVKKISPRIVQEIFDGLINAIVQENAEAGEKYSDKLYNLIYGR